MGVLTTEQLIDFLTPLAATSDAPESYTTAMRHALSALHAEAAAIVTDGAVASTIGFDAQVPTAGLVAAAAAGTDAPGAGRYSFAAAAIGGQATSSLVLARSEQHPFTTEEVRLIRALGRVLELSLSALWVLELQRRHADENGRLVDSLYERQRLLEQLGQIQRAITRRAPMRQVFDAITAGAQHLLDVEMAALCLLEADDPTLLTMRSSYGVAPEVLAQMRRIPVASAGVSGLAVLGDELVCLEDYADSPIAVPELARAHLQAAMAVPVHDGGVPIGCLVVGSYRPGRCWDKADQDILQTFAEHVSLAVTDAQMTEAIQHESHDALTGLASRDMFLDRMRGCFARPGLPRDSGARAGTAVGALIIDLDRFKAVNDSLGHAVGDLLLVAVAQRIQGCLGTGAVAARLGADEFAVLLPRVRTVDDAVPVARRILHALREPFEVGGTEAFVSASIGIACSGPAGRNADELMICADLATYQAKKRGKDRYEIFEPGMQAAFRSDRELESDLRRAVLRDEFELRYQPIVQLRTGDIVGFEALVRWRHPTRGIIAPLEFIPIAEETGLIVPIGEWVLRRACRQAAQWNTRWAGGQPLTVSVNLSAAQLDQADLPSVVADALAEAGLPADRLVLELTESLLVDHRDSTVRQLHEIKALGVRLAIDDFGTGYSSLAYLLRFPVDIIKIDKSFVDDVGDVPAASALTLGIIQLGRALQLSTVAEGIEHAAQLSELTDGDCELGQGYYFAEPLTGTDMGAMLFRPVTPGLLP